MDNKIELLSRRKSRKARRFAAAFLGLCLAAAPLLAQDGSGAQASSPSTERAPGLPSEKMALALSLGGTLVSWGLMLSTHSLAAWAGVMVGPSLGSFYGGCWGRGLLLTGLRVGVWGATFAYVLEHDEQKNTAAFVLMLGTLIGTTIYECATVESAVRKRNAARLAKQNLKLAVAPFALRKGAGLQVRLSF